MTNNNKTRFRLGNVLIPVFKVIIIITQQAIKTTMPCKHTKVKQQSPKQQTQGKLPIKPKQLTVKYHNTIPKNHHKNHRKTNKMMK